MRTKTLDGMPIALIDAARELDVAIAEPAGVGRATNPPRKTRAVVEETAGVYSVAYVAYRCCTLEVNVLLHGCDPLQGPILVP